jgi:hypothetical protein
MRGSAVNLRNRYLCLSLNLALLLSFLDYLTTVYGIFFLGLHEANPFMRAFYSVWWILPITFIIRVLVPYWLLSLLIKESEYYGFTITALYDVMTSVTVISNFVTILEALSVFRT